MRDNKRALLDAFDNQDIRAEQHIPDGVRRVIDEIIKARENEFSRIQARFKTRLSLSSSSADEVIQKRILLKADEAEHDLEQVYAANDSVLRNLFSFTDAILDIKGYTGAGEFAKNFPFVPYQFILMQKVFAEIRKHGNSGKHLSGGERSMLSGFQEAAQKIEDKDEYLVAHVYSDLGLITKFAETDADIYKILHGEEICLPGTEPNRDAAAKVEKYLEIQFNQNLPTTMSDLQDRFQKKPYGWREIDIAAVVAMLIYDQKVTIKYGGATIQPSDPKLPDMLRKKSEIGKTSISKRQVVSIQKIREVRDFLRDFFDEMDVPEDEDGLIAHIVEKFNGELDHYTKLDARYDGHKYPDQGKVKQAIVLVKDILSQQKDNTALIQRVIDREDTLYDMRDELQEVEEFFKTRVTLFDAAVQYEQDLSVDRDYIAKDDEAHEALNQIRLITMMPTGGKFRYDRIPELNGLMAKVKASHGKMLDAKREELLEIVRQCMEEIHTLAGDNATARNISNTADNYFTQQKQKIASYQALALLDGLVPPIWQYKDDTVSRIESIVNPPVKPTSFGPSSSGGETMPVVPKKEVIKAIHRQAMFPAKTLKSEEEIDAYVEKIRTNMKQLLKGCDGIKLN